MKPLLLRALDLEVTERAPVWFHRQAGRFLPSYQTIREKHSLEHLFHTPELAAEITLLPVKDLEVDAAILFSDILVILEALGCTVFFPKAGGISIDKPAILSPSSVRKTLPYVFKTIQLVREKSSVPLIGFCGGPYTVASYLKEISPAILDLITELSIEYLLLQIEAGAQVVQVFDSWAGTLSKENFYTQALPYLQRVVEGVKKRAPITLFCRGSCLYMEELASLHPTCISFDSALSMAEICSKAPRSIAIQGNLDPEVFAGELLPLEEKTKEILESVKNRAGFIFNLGHGVLPTTPIKNAKTVIKIIKNLKILQKY